MSIKGCGSGSSDPEFEKCTDPVSKNDQIRFLKSEDYEKHKETKSLKKRGKRVIYYAFTPANNFRAQKDAFIINLCDTVYTGVYNMQNIISRFGRGKGEMAAG